MHVAPPILRHPSALKDDLARPEAWAAVARTRRVAVRETPTSWVFLLDDDVFEVKRPLDHGAFDLRVRARRRAACEAEVALNRRLAPSVVRGVVPIRRGRDGRAQAGGGGPLVDWAVHLARLPHETRADEMLARGELSASAVEELATRIAAFHARARCDVTTARLGSPSVIEANIEESFAEARPLLEACLSPEHGEEVLCWHRAFLRGHRALFDKRVATGRVREGHGALRLENVYVDDAKIAVLGCCELDDRARMVDVCSDIALLSLDFAARGRVDLAERFLASYARATNDFELYTLIDFYESYRALLHGRRVASAGAIREARRYFLLALSAHRRSLLVPSVVVVGGLIASGKSTVAQRIATELCAPIVDAERTRKAILGAKATRRLEATAWTGACDPTFTERVLPVLLRHAGMVLDSGRPVVIDASFRSKEMRAQARDLANERGVPFRFVECIASREVCLSRLAARIVPGRVPDAWTAIFDDARLGFEPVDELPPTEHLSVRTSGSIDQAIDELTPMLETWPTGFVS